MERDFKIIVADTNWWISPIIKIFNSQFAKILLFSHSKFVTSSELTDDPVKRSLTKAFKDLLVPGNFQNTVICTLTEFTNKYLKQ